MKYLIPLMLFSVTALGEDMTVTWTHPTEYVDTTPLPIEEIARTDIICHEFYEGGVAQTCPFTTISVPAPADSVVISIPTSSKGTRIGVKGVTISVDNMTSEFSNIAYRIWEPSAAPKPPLVDITVTP
jgi:hypothetical protein